MDFVGFGYTVSNDTLKSVDTHSHEAIYDMAYDCKSKHYKKRVHMKWVYIYIQIYGHLLIVFYVMLMAVNSMD